MKKIESFQVDHTKMKPGMYVSRVDGDATTYDMRFKKPNGDSFLSNAQMHTFEHLFATMIRNSEISDDILYFGPMGCQTGFYLLVRNADNETVMRAIKTVLHDLLAYNGEVYGNSAEECGNYKTLDLQSAKEIAREYDAVLQTNSGFSYE